MTMFLQSIDTEYAARLKREHIKQFRQTFGDALTSMEKRTALAKVPSSADATVKSPLDVYSCFEALGYFNPTEQSVAIRSMPEYRFRPNPDKKKQQHPQRTHVPKQRDIRDYFSKKPAVEEAT